MSSAASAFDIVALTNNQAEDWYPDVSGWQVVWESGYAIYLWDGSTITNITNSGAQEFEPTISGSNVVWECLYDWLEEDVGICVTNIGERSPSLRFPRRPSAARWPDAGRRGLGVAGWLIRRRPVASA